MKYYFIEDQEVEPPAGWEELTNVQEESLQPMVKEEEEVQQEDDPKNEGEIEEREVDLGRGRITKVRRTVFSYNA